MKAFDEAKDKIIKPHATCQSVTLGVLDLKCLLCINQLLNSRGRSMNLLLAATELGPATNLLMMTLNQFSISVTNTITPGATTNDTRSAAL